MKLLLSLLVTLGVFGRKTIGAPTTVVYHIEHKGCSGNCHCHDKKGGN